MSSPTPIDVMAWRAKAGSLQEIMSLSGWEVFRESLATHEAQAIETLVQGGDPAAGRPVDYWRGVVAGLRMAASAPQRVIDAVAQMPVPVKKGQS